MHLGRTKWWPFAVLGDRREAGNGARRVGLLATAGLVLLILGVMALRSSSPAAAAGGCRFLSSPASTPAFCDTFDTPQPTGNRSGDLGDLWGVSRTTGNMNFNQPDPWAPSTLDLCGTTISVQSPNDVRICNGQLRESLNDNGTVANLAMYPKQPFDFAGRTGTISFDVSDDSQGNHAAWPELWITDKPSPAPFTHEGSWISVPQNALGLRFATSCDASHVGLDSAVVVRNYAVDDSFNGGSLNVVQDNCVPQASGPNGPLNHFEVRVSQSAVTVYGTAPGSSTLVQIAHITNPNLTFTRGLVWIEDAHYNADKFNSQRIHTFTWDNLAFDGPILPRDLTFDALDSLVPDGNGNAYLGWQATPTAPATMSTLPMTLANISSASAHFLMFNFWAEQAPLTFTYSVNGHQHTYAWPYPDSLSATWKTIIIPILPTDLVAGPNTLTISANATIEIANVDILLAGAGGTPTASPPNPTNTPSASPTSPSTTPPSPTSTSTPRPTGSVNTPAPTRTPLPTATPKLTVYRCQRLGPHGNWITIWQGPGQTCS